MKIYWYMDDPRFEAGTVADIGNIRLYIQVTDRARNNKWKLYVSIRTRKKDGIRDDLKQKVCVAQWDRSLSLKEVQHKAESYLRGFIEDLIAETIFYK
jgi:hypothetical protein